MKNMKKLLLLLLSVGFIGTANAGDISYECTIEKVYELSDTGGKQLMKDSLKKMSLFMR